MNWFFVIAVAFGMVSLQASARGPGPSSTPLLTNCDDSRYQSVQRVHGIEYINGSQVPKNWIVSLRRGLDNKGTWLIELYYPEVDHFMVCEEGPTRSILASNQVIAAQAPKCNIFYVRNSEVSGNVVYLYVGNVFERVFDERKNLFPGTDQGRLDRAKMRANRLILDGKCSAKGGVPEIIIVHSKMELDKIVAKMDDNGTEPSNAAQDSN